MKTTRREFVKIVAIAVASLPVLGALPGLASGAQKKPKDEPLPEGQTAVSESDPVAAAVAYKHDVKNADKARYKKGQFCDGCSLYTSVNKGWGKCSMVTAGLVSAKGWCASWSKKA